MELKNSAELLSIIANHAFKENDEFLKTVLHLTLASQDENYAKVLHKIANEKTILDDIKKIESNIKE